jgi:hypothetical protein
MEKTINLTLEISVKDMNQTLALTGQPLITSEEELKEYQDLSFSTDDIEKMDGKIGMCALLLAARAKKGIADNAPEE